MSIRVEDPKYLMLKGEKAFPGLTYEDFLIDIINLSSFFRNKIPIGERYELVDKTKQSNGENDVYSPTYQLDFKLLIDEDVMRERSKNVPEIDYSQMENGFIFTKTQKVVSQVPTTHILHDINDCNIEDLKNGRYKNKTIKNLINNLKKPKNLFIYYPYEYKEVTIGDMRGFEDMVTGIFNDVLTYRDELSLKKDTFICFKINSFFVILEWVNGHMVRRDCVNELCCTNYKDFKQYSVY